MYINLLTVVVTIIISSICDSRIVSDRTTVSGYCPTLKLDNGRVRYRQRRTFAKFTCNIGYTIVGDKYATCIRGKWDHTGPKCVRASCPAVKSPPNMSVYPMFKGAVLNFYCVPGYVLRGPAITFCTGKMWDSNSLPTCLKNGTKPSKRCDFESDDLCGWTKDLNHDFDWIRKKFEFTSIHIHTGPSYDHSKGEGKDGYYMSIESSSRKENDTARILSPIYDSTSNETCFEFYYHMYGPSIGQLRVYLKQTNQSWILKPENASYITSGNQGNVWKRGFFKVGPIPNPFQIIIEGVRGNSDLGDIAVDDVQLVENCRVYTDDSVSESDSNGYTTSEDTILTPESCQNRCENDSYTSTSSSFQISCSCVETCVTNETCCPDYVTFCVVGNTFATDSDVVQNDTPPPTSPVPSSITTKTTVLMLHLLTRGTDVPRPTTTLATKTTVKVTKATPTTTTSVPKPTTSISTTKRTTSTTQRTIKTVKTVKTTPRPTRPTPKLPIVTKKAQTTLPKETETTDEITTTEESDLVTIANADTDNSEPNDIFPVITAKNEMKKSFLSERTNIVIISSVSLLLACIVSVACVVKHYNSICSARKLRQSQNFDSQSDVRFLTSGEILDFNLRTSDSL